MQVRAKYCGPPMAAKRRTVGLAPMRLSFYLAPVPVRIGAPTQRRRLAARTKVGGFRFQAIKDGGDVRLYSKSGAEYTDRLRGMREAFGKLPTQSAILDGELCLIDPRGAAHFYQLYQRAVFAEDERSKLFTFATSRASTIPHQQTVCGGLRDVGMGIGSAFPVTSAQPRY
jgi:ATP dependent DNA ligase-like protein